MSEQMFRLAADYLLARGCTGEQVKRYGARLASDLHEAAETFIEWMAEQERERYQAAEGAMWDRKIAEARGK